MFTQKAHPAAPWTGNPKDSLVPASGHGGGGGPSGEAEARLPLFLHDRERTLATAGGTPLLEALPPAAAARGDIASGGIVVSLQSSSPPASLLEVAIGRVSSPGLPPIVPWTTKLVSLTRQLPALVPLPLNVNLHRIVRAPAPTPGNKVHPAAHAAALPPLPGPGAVQAVLDGPCLGPLATGGAPGDAAAAG